MLGYPSASDGESDGEGERGIRVHSQFGAVVSNVKLRQKKVKLWMMARIQPEPGFQCLDLPGGKASYLKQVPVGTIIAPLKEIRVEMATGRIIGSAKDVDWPACNAMLESWSQWHANQGR